jgi:hypothetical protein
VLTTKGRDMPEPVSHDELNDLLARVDNFLSAYIAFRNVQSHIHLGAALLQDIKTFRASLDTPQVQARIPLTTVFAGPTKQTLQVPQKGSEAG